MNNTPAIVKGECGGNVYDAPSSSAQHIGQLFAGTKATVYFTTDDGWAAIGAGPRNAEIWGYMRIKDLYVGKNEIYHMTSQIRQLSVEDSCFVYGDAECIHILYAIQKGTFVNVIGNFGNTCFIKSGYQYGYMPADTMRTCLLDLASDSSFLYQADVRRALLTTQISHTGTFDYLISVNVEYTPQYTVNDDIASVAIYVNGNGRYVLSDSNKFCIQVMLEDKIASLVLVPIWASGGELIEDAVIIPLSNGSYFEKYGN